VLLILACLIAAFIALVIVLALQSSQVVTPTRATLEIVSPGFLS